MNAELLSYHNNDEITSIMKQKFASKFKYEANSTLGTNEPLLNIINNAPEEYLFEDKLNKMAFIFPSITKEKIEHILNNNKDISFEEGAEILKEKLISQNRKQEINDNNRNILLSKRRNKRNYNSLLIQTQAQRQIKLPLINSMNNNINIINNNNNKINNIKIEDNSRINIVEKNNKEKVNEEERKKLELKTVDIITEELLNSKDQEDLKKYLFNQLILLEEKKEKDMKIRDIMKGIDILEKDRFTLQKCLNTIIRPINKRNCENNRLDHKIKELNEEINKVYGRILYQESLGNIYLSMQKFNILDIN